MLRFVFSCVVIFSLLIMVPLTSFAAADTQYFLGDTLKVWNRDNVAGGTGTLFGKYSFTRHDALPEQAIKEIGWMILNPGDSIGMHKHDTNEDTYIIISGVGVFTDTNGNEYPVKAGDITIARAGQAHALKNTGTEPLCFLDIIAQNDGAKAEK